LYDDIIKYIIFPYIECGNLDKLKNKTIYSFGVYPSCIDPYVIDITTQTIDLSKFKMGLIFKFNKDISTTIAIGCINVQMIWHYIGELGVVRY
jgi:hypothetical protein